jgi:hypothetical protein
MHIRDAPHPVVLWLDGYISYIVMPRHPRPWQRRKAKSERDAKYSYRVKKVTEMWKELLGEAV